MGKGGVERDVSQLKDKIHLMRRILLFFVIDNPFLVICCLSVIRPHGLGADVCRGRDPLGSYTLKLAKIASSPPSVTSTVDQSPIEVFDN